MLTLEADLGPEVGLNLVNAVGRNGVDGVYGGHAILFVKDLHTLLTNEREGRGFPDRLGIVDGFATCLDTLLYGRLVDQLPLVLRGTQARQDVAGVVRIRHPGGQERLAALQNKNKEDIK